jgi:uncharacterized protein YfdQ (DUF2303 family)
MAASYISHLGKDKIMDNSDTQAAIDAGKALGKVEIKTHEWHGRQCTPFVIIPTGFNVAILDSVLPKPEKRVSVQMDELDSFVRYVNEHKTDATRIFSHVTGDGGSFCAVIDYHGQTEAGECKHNVTYICPQSVEWKRWTGANARNMNQTDFARFLEDNLVDIVDPKGTEILEIATSLEAKSAVDFASGVRLNNGQQKLVYQETIEARAGEKGDLSIPEKFTLGLAPFQGGEKYKIEARLRYRIGSGKLTLYYELNRPHAIIEDACKGIVSTINEKTGINPFAGFIAK